MGFEYAEIRRAVYEPAPDSDPGGVGYETLPFPEQFASGILDLLNRDREGKENLRTAPTHQLNGLVQALASEVSVMRRGRAAEDYRGHNWLYHPRGTLNPLPEPVLHRLLDYWTSGLGAGEGYARAARRLGEQLREDPPQWAPVDVPLLRTWVGDGGTAAPNSLQYTLIPDHYARRIQRLEPFRHKSRTLKFRAIARGPRQQGAELMSQPLDHVDEDGRVWWFSVLITVTLHTVPFDPRPKIHLHAGLRRWATHPDPEKGMLRLGYGHGTSVYLRPTSPWLPGAPVSERFGVARLGWDRGIGRHSWKRGGPAELLSRLAGCRPFPEVDALLREPDSWLHGGGGLEALVVHANTMGGHGVGAGLMSHQRSEILEWAEKALQPDLVRVPDLVRSQVPSDAPVNVRRAVSKERRPAAEKEAAHRLRSLLGVLCAHRSASGEAVFEARLLWQSHGVRNAAITALTEVLGLSGDGGAEKVDDLAHESSVPGGPVVLAWDTPEVVVRLSCLRLGSGLGGTLGVDPKSRTRRADRANAIDLRRQELAKFLAADGASVAQPGLALVEIPRRRSFDHRGNDPKFPMRLGCADAGVVTQFIVDRGAHRAHRARAAWLDGLRQLGVSTVPMPDLPAGVPAGTQFLAIWLASTQRDSPAGPRHKLPVAVLVRPSAVTGERVLGWDPEALAGVGAWTSYPRLLTRLPALARVEPEELDEDPGERWVPWSVHHRDLEQQKAVVEGFIQKVLWSREATDHPIVVLVHAQNARQHWTWIQDGVVRRDLVRTGLAPIRGVDPDLRLVRVRTGEQRETGAWWAIGHPDGINGISAGLWTAGKHAPDDLRIFYSTTAKASSAGGAAVSADKLAPRPLRTGERKGELTIDTEVPGWNPALVELAVLGCHRDQGDHPEVVAMALHQLRQAPDHLNALRLPLPLHLARHAQEYVLPVLVPDEERDEDFGQVQEEVEVVQAEVVED
ncbi:pPIWI_RE module domain-containing protein [Amycolatopsis samaneae]|uniref:PPIWI_RE module domain-containing protein n=1 Tax=Amycolatopsis samaneae TaxID=664691 RepID=A0ABW5GXP5_9PSEU